MSQIYLLHSASQISPPETYKNAIHPMFSYDHIPDASVLDLFVEGTYFSTEQFKTVIKKLRQNGVIKISGPDILSLSRNIVTNLITPADARSIVSSGELLYSVLEIIALLQEAGCTITHKSISKCRFFVTAERKVK